MSYIKISLIYSLLIISFDLKADLFADFAGYLNTADFHENIAEIANQVDTHFLKDPSNPHIIFLGRSLFLENMIIDVIDPTKSSSIPGSNMRFKAPNSIYDRTGLNGARYIDHLKHWIPSLEELKARGQKSVIISDFGSTGISLRNFEKLVNEFYEGKIEVKVKVFMHKDPVKDRVFFKKSEIIPISSKRLDSMGRTKLDKLSKFKQFVWGQDSPTNLMPKENIDGHQKSLGSLRRIHINDNPVLSKYLNKKISITEKSFNDFLESPAFREISPEISRQIDTHFIKDPSNPHIVFLGRSLTIESMTLEALDPKKMSTVPGTSIKNIPIKNIDDKSGFNGMTYREHLKNWLPSLEKLERRGQKSIIIADYADSGRSIRDFEKLINEFYDGKIEIKVKVYISEYNKGDRLLFTKNEKISINQMRQQTFGHQNFDQFSKHGQFEWGKDDPAKLKQKDVIEAYNANLDTLKKEFIKKDQLLSTHLREFKNSRLDSKCLWKMILKKLPH